MGYTLAVFGEAKLSKNLLFDTLADHFRFGPPDADGYYTVTSGTRDQDVDLVIGIDSAAGAEALGDLDEWCARANLGYSLVLRTGVRPANLVKNAVRTATCSDVPAALAHTLEAADGQGREVSLILAIDPAAPGVAALHLLSLVRECANAYSLGEGLLPIDPADLLGDEPESSEETREAFERLEKAVKRPGAPVDVFGLLEALDGAVDAFQAEVELQLYRLRSVISQARQEAKGIALEAMDAAGGEPEPDTTVVYLAPEPVPGGDQMAIAVPQPIEVQAPAAPRAPRVRLEWKDPATGEWKPKGPGRPRKDVEIREVRA